MPLVLEEYSENTFKFLEGKFFIQNDSMLCMWQSKNFESVNFTGPQKFFTSQDFFSYWSYNKETVRLTSITGRLSTLLGYSFTYVDLIKSFGYLLVDLFTRHYPKRFAFFSFYKVL